jgi:hypothetical protein
MHGKVSFLRLGNDDAALARFFHITKALAQGHDLEQSWRFIQSDVWPSGGRGILVEDFVTGLPIRLGVFQAVEPGFAGVDRTLAKSQFRRKTKRQYEKQGGETLHDLGLKCNYS